MTIALATIYNDTLKELGVLGRGQTATDADTDDMSNAYLEVFERLDQKNFTRWDSTDAVPKEHAQAIVALMAYSRINRYGVDPERRASITANAAQAEFDISELLSPDKTGQTEIENF